MLIFIVPGLVKTKPQTPNPLTAKVQLPAEYLDVYRMLQIWKSRIHHLCSQKYFRRLYSYPNALNMNCHFYVMEATLESKRMYFQNYDYAVWRGPKRCIKCCHILTDLKNIKIKQKQQEETIRCQDSVWLFKWKEVNRILEEYIFIFSSGLYFCRRV